MLEMEQTGRKPKVDLLTSARFAAALGVVLSHFGESAGMAVPSALGPMMVVFFFVLSGFVLTITYLHDATFSTARFIANRFSRIAPMYFFALALTLWILWRAGRPIDPNAAALHVLFLQAWISPYPMSINPPAWSISVEVFFYALFPLLLLKWSKVGAGVLLQCSLWFWLLTQLLLTWLVSFEGVWLPAHDVVFYHPLSHFCAFVLGMVAATIHLNRGTQLFTPLSSGFVLGCAFVLICAAVFLAGSGAVLFGFPVPWASSFFSPLFAVFVLALASRPVAAHPVLASSLMQKLGDASYSFYILQIPLAMLIYPELDRRLELPPALDLAVFVAMLAAISVGSYRWFEKPTMRLARSAASAWFIRPVRP